MIRRLAGVAALLSRFGEGQLRRFAPNAPQVGLSEYNRHVGIGCAAQIRVNVRIFDRRSSQSQACPAASC
jgi:hypothetical protein